MAITENYIDPASFRDSAGFVFFRNGKVFRQVNIVATQCYDTLMESGLYKELADAGLLVSHTETNEPPLAPDSAYKVIQPEQIPFISYPYEWCFSQLKDAALMTLQLVKKALAKDMILKDASAYNVQFRNGKPIFIDTLSFEGYNEGEPWIGYKQFCQHFLAPLALGSYINMQLAQSLMKGFIDGVPLELASRLLPTSSKFRLGVLFHLHLHAAAQHRYSDNSDALKKMRKIPKNSLLGIINQLYATVAKMKGGLTESEWGEYYRDDKNNYDEESASSKKDIVSKFISIVDDAKTCWDFGGNTGRYSGLAADKELDTIVLDIDNVAIEKCYRGIKEDGQHRLLPLVFDLANPSPAIGWNNTERGTVWDRGKPDLALALALVHHLCISNNTPLEKVAAFFSEKTKYLIIEFVPKSDSQVQILLATRKDIFPNYCIEGFEAAMSAHFTLLAKEGILGSERTVFLYKNKHLDAVGKKA